MKLLFLLFIIFFAGTIQAQEIKELAKLSPKEAKNYLKRTKKEDKEPIEGIWLVYEYFKNIETKELIKYELASVIIYKVENKLFEEVVVTESKFVNMPLAGLLGARFEQIDNDWYASLQNNVPGDKKELHTFQLKKNQLISEPKDIIQGDNKYKTQLVYKRIK